MRLQLGVNFSSKSEEKQKQSPSLAMFSLPNSNEDQKNTVYSPVCAIVIRLIEMKTKFKRFYLIILFVCGFIVRYLFYRWILYFLCDI